MSEQTTAPTVADSTYWDDPAKSPKRVSGAVVPNADQVLFDVAIQVLTAHAVTGQRLRMDVPAVQCVCDRVWRTVPEHAQHQAEALAAAKLLATPVQTRAALAEEVVEMAREHYGAQLTRGGTLTAQQIALAEAEGMRLVAGRLAQPRSR